MGDSGGPSALDQMGAKRKAQIDAANQVLLEQATKERDKAAVKKDSATIMYGGRQTTIAGSAPVAPTTTTPQTGLAPVGTKVLGS